MTISRQHKSLTCLFIAFCLFFYPHHVKVFNYFHEVTNINIPIYNNGIRSIHYAAAQGNVEKLKELVDKGHDVNHEASHGLTPLFFATQHNRLNSAKFLIENGANVNHRNKLGKAAISYSSNEENHEIVSYLVSVGAAIDLKWGLRAVCEYGWDDIFEYISQTTNTYNIRYPDNNTLLHNVGSTYIAKVLIESGIDVNSRNYLQQTPFHKVKSIEIAQLLIDNGADVNVLSGVGSTPIFFSKSPELTEFLIAQGAGLDFHNRHDESAFTKTKNFEIKEILLNSGYNLSKLFSNGSGLLLARVKSLKEAKLLIRYGININLRGNNGETAVCFFNNRLGTLNESIKKLLVENGAECQ